jgi:putative transport protein
MSWVQHAVTTAPEIFLLLAVGLGTILGRIRIRGFAIGATACTLIVAVVLVQAHGLTLLGVGILVTLTPMVVGTLFAHRVLRMNPVVICGSLAGAMTVDAAVSGACDVAESQTPVLGVAVPYAIANVFLTVLGPIIVGLTFVG